MSGSVIFLKCHFCQKSFNKDSLIDITSGFVMLNDENLEIKSLIFDTCFHKIDDGKPSFICHGCNNTLVSFHLFKRDCKKYSNFMRNIQKLEVLFMLEKFLDSIDDIKALNIVEDATKWSIQFKEVISKEELVVFEPADDDPYEIGMLDEETVKSEVSRSKINLVSLNEEVEVIWKCQFCQEEYKSKEEITTHLTTTHQNHMNINTNEPIIETWQCVECKSSCESINAVQSHLKTHKVEDEEVMHMEDISEIDTTEVEYESKSPKRRKFNTLNDLHDDQMDWIRQQVKESEILKGKKKQFKCSICGVILCTQASLVRHLRDLHVLNDPTGEKSILKEQLNICKVVTDTEIFWKCSQCERDRIYTSEQSFKLHYRMNHIRGAKIDNKFIASCRTSEQGSVKDVWKCPKCFKIFKNRYGLRNHLKSIHPNNFDDFGNEIIETKVESDSIKVSSSAAKSENYCDECGVKFSSAQHHMKAKVHKESHETFKTLAPVMPHFKCDKCRTVFNSEMSLAVHLEMHDDPHGIQTIHVDGLTTFGATYFKDPTGDADEACLDEAVWKCGHCDVRYFDENDCVVHQLLLHTSTYNCFVDNREFPGLIGCSKYLQHMKNKHPELFPHISYACSGCKMEFPTIYEKLAHQKFCKLKKFQCDLCSKRYLTKYQLQTHILFEVGITGFSCEICGKKCKTMSDLRIHNNIHSGSRPYKCSLCDKSFKTPAARSTHLEKHTLEEGITCEICGAKCGNRSLYQRHKRYQHNQEFRDSQYEKNSCNLCDKSFLRTSHYKQHLKLHHGIN